MIDERRFKTYNRAVEAASLRNKQKGGTYVVVWDGESFMLHNRTFDGPPKHEVVWMPRWLDR